MQGYSLLSASQHGIFRRNLDKYNRRVQAVIVSHIDSFFSGAKPSDLAGFDDWVSGLYFNSAIQRIVWAAERMLFSFARISCPCGKRRTEDSVSKDRPGLRLILRGAFDRLCHIEQGHPRELPMVRAVREQFLISGDSGQVRAYYLRGDSLDRTKILAMLRYDVNNRKHEIFQRSKHLDHLSAGEGDNETWHTSGADFQMDLAIEGFRLVCSAYAELETWDRAPRS